MRIVVIASQMADRASRTDPNGLERKAGLVDKVDDRSVAEVVRMAPAPHKKRHLMARGTRRAEYTTLHFWGPVRRPPRGAIQRRGGEAALQAKY